MSALGVFIVLVLVMAPAGLVARAAARRGRSPVAFFVFAVVLLWPAALITLMVIGEPAERRTDELRPGPRTETLRGPRSERQA